MTLPEGPGVAISVDYFGPLPVTPRGSTYILLITDRFSRRADMFPDTAAEFTAEDTANIPVNKYIPLWRCPRTIISDNGLQFCSRLPQAVYQLMGVRTFAASSYHPDDNSGVERVNHTMTQTLDMVVNDRQDDWDLQLPHVEFAYNNSVSAVTGVLPNEGHMGKLLRLPLTVFERTGVAGHQSLAHDYLPYCDLATDRQQRANDIVPKDHALTVSRVNRRNSAFADALRLTPTFDVRGWTWVYNSAFTIRQGVKANTDAKILKAKLALDWTGPSKVLAVGRCSVAETPDGSPLGYHLLYLDLPFRPARFGCSPACGERTLQALYQPPQQQWHAEIPTGGADAVCPQHFFQETPSLLRHSRRRFGSPSEVEKITGHQSVRGRGGVIAVVFKTHWVGLSESSWEREMDL